MPKGTPAGGAALKRAIRAARAHTDYTSDMALSVAAGVHYDTLMNWYADRTTPRPAEVRKVATTLGVPYAELIAAYEGTAPDPQPLHEAIAELVSELRESRLANDRQVQELVHALRELAESERAHVLGNSKR